MVPKGWEVKTLEQAKITVTDGDRGKDYPKSSEFFDSGYCLFLSAKNVTKNGFSFLDTQFISREKHKKLRKGVVKRGDIVLTTRGSVGQFAYYDHTVNFENIRINSGMVTLGCSNSELESDFFYALSKSSLISRQIDSAAFGSAQPQLTVKIIKSLKLPVPPLREQQKIAKILSTWDKAISTTERLIENSTQQKKALMQQLLMGKKRLLDESGQRFAGEWEEKTLIDAGMTVTDGDRGKEYPNSSEFYDEGDYLFLSAKNVTKKGFLFEDTQFISKEKYEKLGKGIVNRGDVVLTTRGTVGQTAYYDDSVQYEFLRVNSGMVTLGCNNSELESNFFYALTNSSLFTRQVESLTFGSAQPQLTIRIIKSLKVPIPPVPEQQKIATVLTNADKEIELLEQQLADLQQEKKALMQVLLTGKKRVRVDGEVA